MRTPTGEHVEAKANENWVADYTGMLSQIAPHCANDVQAPAYKQTMQ